MGGRTKKSLGTNTRCVGNSFSSTSGGTSKASTNQGELAVGPCFDGGLSLFGFMRQGGSGTASSSSRALAWGFTQKYQFARRAVELIGLETRCWIFR